MEKKKVKMIPLTVENLKKMAEKRAYSLTPKQMNAALHKYRLLDAAEVKQYLDGFYTDYESDLGKLMQKGATCYHSAYMDARKIS